MEKMEQPKESIIERKTWNILAALFVRFLLVLHSILATWRVVIAYDDLWMWCIIYANIPLLLEAMMVVKLNGGNEWKGWCPCFFLYLASTLPSIWLLQLSQNDKLQVTSQSNMILPTPQYLIADSTPYVESGNFTVERSFTGVANFTGSANFTESANVTGSANVTESANITENTTLSVLNSTLAITTTEQGILDTLEAYFDIEDTTWIVVIQEALMYLIVLGRWILPRAGVSRVALSDLLLLYLAMASDIMELYAVFDEQVVQENRNVTYAILTVWSVSFLQFVPVLVQKNKYRHLLGPNWRRITRACGDHFSEVVTTLSSILLQDGPFFCLRLYIMIDFKLITYSLVFFVLKNFVSVLLLFYRLVILCLQLPCCYSDGKKVEEYSHSELSSPIRYSDTFIETNGRYFYSQPVLKNHHRPQTSTPSQVFVVTTNGHRYITKPGMVNRQPHKAASARTERTYSLGSL